MLAAAGFFSEEIAAVYMTAAQNSRRSLLRAFALLVEAQRVLQVARVLDGAPRGSQSHLRSGNQEYTMYLSSGLLHCLYRLSARCSVWR